VATSPAVWLVGVEAMLMCQAVQDLRDVATRVAGEQNTLCASTRTAIIDCVKGGDADNMSTQSGVTSVAA
jgi:hypothetical protein